MLSFLDPAELLMQILEQNSFASTE